MIKDFFWSITFVFSGAKRFTRILVISKQEVWVLWFARYPAMLRVLAHGYPWLLEVKSTKAPTRLQQSMLLALKVADTEGFKESVEIEKREIAARKEYRRRLVKRRGWDWKPQGDRGLEGPITGAPTREREDGNADDVEPVPPTASDVEDDPEAAMVASAAAASEDLGNTLGPVTICVLLFACLVNLFSSVRSIHFSLHSHIP
jgi:hypothetical protein